MGRSEHMLLSCLKKDKEDFSRMPEPKKDVLKCRR